MPIFYTFKENVIVLLYLTYILHFHATHVQGLLDGRS
jgi:hypothetical protein